MNFPSRRSVGVGVAAAVLTYLLLTSPPWLTDSGAQREKDSSPPHLGGGLMPWKELEQPCPEILGRTQAKRRLARELAQGRRTLMETAAQFRDLDGEMPEDLRARFRDTYPGQTDAERYCRQVISYVEVEIDRVVEDGLRLRHPEADAILARLRQELERYLAAGALVLPE